METKLTLWISVMAVSLMLSLPLRIAAADTSSGLVEDCHPPAPRGLTYTLQSTPKGLMVHGHYDEAATALSDLTVLATACAEMSYQTAQEIADIYEEPLKILPGSLTVQTPRLANENINRCTVAFQLRSPVLSN